MALYERNYAKAREVFPEHELPADLGWDAAQRDDFYRSVARLAHKAFNPDYVNFYIAPVVSGAADVPKPDRSRFHSDYNQAVLGFRREIWGE